MSRLRVIILVGVPTALASVLALVWFSRHKKKQDTFAIEPNKSENIPDTSNKTEVNNESAHQSENEAVSSEQKQVIVNETGDNLSALDLNNQLSTPPLHSPDSGVAADSNGDSGSNGEMGHLADVSAEEICDVLESVSAELSQAALKSTATESPIKPVSQSTTECTPSSNRTPHQSPKKLSQKTPQKFPVKTPSQSPLKVTSHTPSPQKPRVSLDANSEAWHESVAHEQDSTEEQLSVKQEPTSPAKKQLPSPITKKKKKKKSKHQLDSVSVPDVIPSNADLLNNNDQQSIVSSSSLSTDLAVDENGQTVYEFAFPTDLCGMLIGKNGKNVNYIKEKTGAEIFLKRRHYESHVQDCAIIGTSNAVSAALSMIREKFPPNKFHHVCFDRINVPQLTSPPEVTQLSLPEGVSADVIVSSVVDANHVFIQQITHPTFSSLPQLKYYMEFCYTDADNIVPQLPRPVEVGVLCAAPLFNSWFRAQVVSVFEETDECDIRYVDYGGYAKVSCSTLRQIRSDFTSLPFQSSEVYLACVVPPSGAETFTDEARATLEELVKNKILQVHTVAYEEDGVPYVQLFAVDQMLQQSQYINQEMVNRGVAGWFDLPQAAV